MTYAQVLHQRGRLMIFRENVLDALEIRFNEIPEGLREVINGIDDETKLRALHREAIQCASLEVFVEEI